MSEVKLGHVGLADDEVSILSEVLRESRAMKTQGMDAAGKPKREKKAYLSISHLSKALKDLLRCILIFRHADHESNKLLKGHIAFSGADIHKNLMHLLVVIHEAKTCKCSREFQFMQ